MSLLRWVLDLLYPPLCPFCQRLLDRHAGEEFLCERCRGEELHILHFLILLSA